MTLYEHWLHIATTNATARALVDAASGQHWTFAELHARANAEPVSREPIREARGRGVDFLITALASWRDGNILCPCENQDDPIPTTLTPPANACHVKRTSGSTGAPRAVWFTEEQLAADAHQIVTTMGLRNDWPNLGIISLAHSYGFSNLVLPLLLHGIPLVLVKDALPATIKSALQSFDHVTLPAVPAMWRAWLGAGILDQRVQLAISAGAPLTLALEQAIYEQCSIKVHNFYGSTECGGIAYDRSTLPRTEPAFVGTAMDGVNLAIVNTRLEVTSPAVGLGYADDLHDPSLKGGQFLTTDHALIKRRDAVYLQGRHGESINVAGRKVSPQIIEEAILKLPTVIHAIVFGIPSKNTERVDEIVAVVHPEDGAGLNTITEALSLPAWQRPRRWWVCEDLRPNSRGKISRSQWRERYLQHPTGR